MEAAESSNDEVDEIRAMIARTARLWPHAPSEENSYDARSEFSFPRHQQTFRDARSEFKRSFSSLSLSARNNNVAEPDAAVGDESDAFFRTNQHGYEVYGDDSGETESDTSEGVPEIDSYIQQPLIASVRLGSGQHDLGQLEDASDGEVASAHNLDQRYDAETDGVQTEGGVDNGSVGLQTDEDDLNISNMEINVSKARAIQSGMVANLIRLGFNAGLAKTALEAGILEIEHYDSDCELAYVDIFLSLVKMVCDAHLDVVDSHPDSSAPWIMNSFSNADGSDLPTDADVVNETRVLPIKWPVFDMAQFEFGNARPGTCFDSVCVLTNLPKVSLDRSEELMELLSCNLFCMIGDPIQVVIPSINSTGRTKGHAFLEFDDPGMARTCAAAVDGLTWGRGPFGRIRGSLFRSYQVKLSVGNTRARTSLISTTRLSTVSDRECARAGGRQSETSTSSYADGVELLDRQAEQHAMDDDDAQSSDDDERYAPPDTPLHFDNLSYSPSRVLTEEELALHTASSSWTDRQEPFRQNPVLAPRVIRGYELSFSSGDESDFDDSSMSADSVLELQPIDRTSGEPRGTTGDNDRVSESNARVPLSPFMSCARLCENLQSAPATDMFLLPSLDGNDGESDYDRVMHQSLVLGEHYEDLEQYQPSSETDKPWRAYCKELIAQNREMHDQVAVARRRIVQLGHNNQKLHLLIDRVERDRDGLMFENDLLQNQLQGAEVTERHHYSLMQELALLRQRLHRGDLKLPNRPVPAVTSELRELDEHQNVEWTQSLPKPIPADLFGSEPNELDASQTPPWLANTSMSDLKEWERGLEAALSRVRAAKEEKAVELQKKLDRQVEEQQELKLCVICLSNDKTILCLPCRHLCLCGPCSSREEVDKCPICRLEIEEMLQVYA